MKDKSLAFVNATRTWGGIKTWTLDLAMFMHEQGWQVQIICRKGDRLAQAAKARGLKCREVRFGPDYNPWMIGLLWWWLRQDKVGVVITNTSKCLRVGGIAAKLAGAFHVNRLGSYGDVQDRFKTRWDYRLWVDRVIVCSNHLAHALGRFSWLERKIVVFHNGTKIPAATSKPNIQRGINIAILAMLSKRKQVDRVILSLSQLTTLDWHLSIGGQGPEEISLKEQVQALGLTNRVTFLGMVSPAAILSDAHLGVLYSSEEAFGTALIEYMAYGCAVLASNTGGATEIFDACQGQKFGILVDSKSEADLAEALGRCLKSPEMITAWGNNARQAAMGVFSLEKTFSKIAAFLVNPRGKHGL
jgi:glycosyltransferase involved in cell wall biosynthesis